MKIGAVVGAVLIVAGLCAGCSRDTAGEPTVSSSAAPKPLAVLDGTYRLDIDRERQLDNGEKNPQESFWLLYAFRSTCHGDTCVATAKQVQPDNPAQAIDEQSAIFDFVNGAWVRTSMVRLGCADQQVDVPEWWSLRPRSDGTLTGTRRLGFNTAECSDVYEQPVTATRVGGVDLAVLPADPASVAARKPSAGAGFTGRYDRTKTVAGEEPTKDQVDVVTGCVRNSEQCVAFQSAKGDQGWADVWALVLADSRWSTAAAIDAECADGASAVAETHIEYQMPEQPGNPIPQLTGVQRNTYPDVCPGTKEVDIVLERVGD